MMVADSMPREVATSLSEYMGGNLDGVGQVWYVPREGATRNAAWATCPKVEAFQGFSNPWRKHHTTNYWVWYMPLDGEA